MTSKCVHHMVILVGPASQETSRHVLFLWEGGDSSRHSNGGRQRPPAKNSTPIPVRCWVSYGSDVSMSKLGPGASVPKVRNKVLQIGFLRWTLQAMFLKRAYRLVLALTQTRMPATCL